MSSLRRHRLIFAAAGCAVALLTTAATCDPSAVSSVPGQDILDLINARRAEAGCPALQGDDHLRTAADGHAVDMRDHEAVRNDPNHLGSDGSTIVSRIADAGFSPASRVGEIMYWASGPPGNTPEATVDWWMHSAGHRAQIETCEYTHVGVGLVYPGGVAWYTTVDFGAH